MDFEIFSDYASESPTWLSFMGNQIFFIFDLNPAISKFGVCAYLLKMRGINGADVFIYFKPLITKQIR